MRINSYGFYLAIALLLVWAMLLSAVPAFAIQGSTADATTLAVLADNTTFPQTAPPPPAPEPPDNAYPTRPRPIQPTWPNYTYYRWYTPDTPYYNNPVVVYQEPRTTYQPVYYVPVVNSFSADISYIQPGQSSTLTWTTSNADTISITPSIGTVAASGSFTVTPEYTTTYTVSAQNTQGTVSASTTVTVAPAVYSYYDTNNAGTVAGAATTGTGGTGTDNAMLNNVLNELMANPLYILLLCLLALAAVVAICLMVRKPAVSYVHNEPARPTGYMATVAAPANTVPVATALPSDTTINPGAAASFVLPAGTILHVNSGTLGRRDFAELAQTEKAALISRQHLLVTYEGNEYLVEDLDSTNGTRLNGIEIRGSGKHVIENGDTIELAGAVKLTFRA